jgi:enamine deaminase RidA (YjgF/YER057c/UK114 family)
MSKPSKEFLSPKTLIAPGPAGYSHIAKVNRGTIVYLSGQVSSDASGKVVGEGNFEAQVEQIFANLKIAVEAAGGTMADIVKLNYYRVRRGRPSGRAEASSDPRLLYQCRRSAGQHVRRQPPDAAGLADRDRGGCRARCVKRNGARKGRRLFVVAGSGALVLPSRVGNRGRS